MMGLFRDRFSVRHPRKRTPHAGPTSIRVAKLGKRLHRSPPAKSVIYAALGLPNLRPSLKLSASRKLVVQAGMSLEVVPDQRNTLNRQIGRGGHEASAVCRSGGGAARSHQQILRASRERSRLSERYP